MENLEDILKLVFSLVFAAIYFFGGQMFKGNKEDESPRSESLRKSGQDNREPDEHEARQQEIREAIRRKIMERRSKNAGSESVFEESIAQSQEPSKNDSKSFKEMASRLPEANKSVQEAAKADAGFSWDASDNVYERQMQERLQQIEATRRRAEALKRKVGRIDLSTRDDGASSKGSTSETLLSVPVRSAFSNPRVARAAFIYSEVLGKPLSLRNPRSSFVD